MGYSAFHRATTQFPNIPRHLFLISPNVGYNLAMIRILIVHPSKLTAGLFASVLNEEKDIYVVAQAQTVEEALYLAPTSNCNVVLVSVALPDNGALKLTELITEEHPEIKVLVIGMPDTEHVILQYVMAGASGYVLQEVPVQKLFDNIRAAHEDKALISPEIAAAFMEHLADFASLSTQDDLNPAAVAELTPREREVLVLIGEGLTNQEIADQLYIELGTVKNHVHNILRKLDVSSREEAAAHLPYLDEEADA